MNEQARYFWLSFCDGNKPKGKQFLGACIVEVNEQDIVDAKADIDVRFPQHLDGAEDLAAASRKAWRLGCNPGGEMAATEIDPIMMPKDARVGVLFSKKELKKQGWI